MMWGRHGSETQELNVPVVPANPAVRRRFMGDQSDTESLAASDSGDEDIELPVVEPVAPVLPSAAAQRAGFTQLDQWDLDVFGGLSALL